VHLPGHTHASCSHGAGARRRRGLAIECNDTAKARGAATPLGAKVMPSGDGRLAAPPGRGDSVVRAAPWQAQSVPHSTPMAGLD